MTFRKLKHRCQEIAANALGPAATIIHTPKCGGTFLHAAYRVHELPRIRSIGHGCLRQLLPAGRTGQLVGLIRDPIDWYTSYLAFCRQGLREAARSVENFPASHPICVFSKDGTSSLAEMIRAMANKALLTKLVATRSVANVYTLDISDVFEFMHRTDSGFWTWTMMYHFARCPTSALRNRDDVLQESVWIAKNVSFIHQEHLCEDVERVLKLAPPVGFKRMNCSKRTEADVLESDTCSIVSRCDGLVSGMLYKDRQLRQAG